MTTLLTIVWLHFLADFILQTDEMAKGKSHSFKWLGLHALTYSLPFFFFGWKYAVLNGLLHGLVDFFTSRINSYLWKKGKIHWFFVGIGADQAIHASCLFLSYKHFFGWFK